MAKSIKKTKDNFGHHQIQIEWDAGWTEWIPVPKDTYDLEKCEEVFD